MSRPLMQKEVELLEDVFAPDKALPNQLALPGNERQHRHVPKAVVLLTEVQATVCPGISMISPITSASSRALTIARTYEPAVLFEHPLASARVPLQTPVVIHPRPASIALVLLNPPAQELLPIIISVDDACRLLNVTPGSTWESIEQARRTLVMSAHPSNSATMSPSKRAKALTEAARVNAACLTLFTLRCGS